MVNILVGYSFLVDRQGRVRWRAHSFAQPGELDLMRQHTRALLAEKA